MYDRHACAVCWNSPEILSLIHSFLGTIVLVLSGHGHEGAHRVDAAGIHPCLVKAALEGDVGTPSHTIVDVYADKIMLQGSGNVRSLSMDLHELAHRRDAHRIGQTCGDYVVIEQTE